jgi:capsule polysaccharide export protein KpsE/RkpR
MAYLGYKNKAFMNYQKEQERVKIWKIKQKAERKRRRELKNVTNTTIIQLVVVALIIAFYGVFASAIIAEEKGSKVGVGNFVMAVSYTDSYDDLTYISHFINCDHAMKYYNDNCTDAKIMMCQQQDYIYMPIGFNSDSSFDFEPTDSQSCGFVGVQKPKFVEE